MKNTVFYIGVPIGELSRYLISMSLSIVDLISPLNDLSSFFIFITVKYDTVI